MKTKTLEDHSFDELVDIAAGQLLQDILAGTKFRTAAWRAVELGARWNHGVQSKERESKKLKRKKK